MNLSRSTSRIVLAADVKAVCASMFEFDERGNAVRTDVHRAMKILVDAGFDGPGGVEFLGLGLGEREGVVLGRKLLEGVQRQLAGATASRPRRAREVSRV